MLERKSFEINDFILHSLYKEKKVLQMMDGMIVLFPTGPSKGNGIKGCDVEHVYIKEGLDIVKGKDK